jgi:ankyrin repeat protein
MLTACLFGCGQLPLALPLMAQSASGTSSAGTARQAEKQQLENVFKQGKANDIKAIDKGSLDSRVKALYGRPPLHLAAEYCNVNVAKYLIGRGADINARAADQSTALHVTARIGCLPVATLLIESKADPESAILPQMAEVDVGEAGSLTYKTPPPSAMKGTPLHWAAYYDKPEIVAFLIAHGSKVGADDGSGLLPIHRAAQSGDLSIIQALVAAESPLRTPKNEESNRYSKPPTPLHFAKSVDVAEYFVANGIGIDEDSTDYGKPIHAAAEFGNVEVAGYLIEHGASVNAVCLWPTGGLSLVQATPLWVAAWSGNLKAVDFFVKNGGDVKYKSSEGGSLLHAAAMNGNGDVIRYLVGRGLSVEERSKFPNAFPMVRGWADITPLGVAADYGQLPAVQALVKAGADVNASFEDTWNALAVAIVSRRKNVVLYLLEKGANLGKNSGVKNWNTTDEINRILKQHFKGSGYPKTH